MFGARHSPKGCNFVHNDEIWKDHVHRELQTLRKWPDTWGFLASHYQAKHQHHEADSQTSSPQTLTVHHQRSFYSQRMSVLQSKLSKTADYPRTTAEEIGWNNEDIRKLEMYGRHARGKMGIEKLLKWPREGIL